MMVSRAGSSGSSTQRAPSLVPDHCNFVPMQQTAASCSNLIDTSKCCLSSMKHLRLNVDFDFGVVRRPVLGMPVHADTLQSNRRLYGQTREGMELKVSSEFLEIGVGWW